MSKFSSSSGSVGYVWTGSGNGKCEVAYETFILARLIRWKLSQKCMKMEAASIINSVHKKPKIAEVKNLEHTLY